MLKGKKTLKSNIGPLKKQNDEITSDPKEMAEILQNQYAASWSTPQLQSNNGKPPPKSNPPEKKLEDLEFDIVDVIEAINSLPKNSTPGPDGVGAFILKDIKSAIAVPLYILWRKSLNDGKIPDIMKEANVIPIYKKGSKKLPENYRPISLTSHVIKVFEKIIKNGIVNFLENNNLLNNFQHGFRKRRSCLTELLDYYNNILDSVIHGKNVDVVYLDFSKAFDKVDHRIILQKAKKLGINGKLLNWIKQFLTDRHQRTIVQGWASNPMTVQSGVPQGTVLGPLLFIIMLNDISEKLNCDIYSFADDTRLVKIISCLNDAELFQKDLETSYEWTDINNLQFNTNKFELIKFGNNDHLKRTTSYKTPSSQTIPEKENIKDLGVTISNDLNFSNHILNVVAKSQQISGYILRTFKS